MSGAQRGEGTVGGAPDRIQMDCFGRARGETSALEFAETFYKTAALVRHRVRCGKPTCRCADGQGHGPYSFLHWRDGTSQRRRYVRQADAAAVRRVIERRHRDDRAARLAAAFAGADLRRLRAWLRDLERDLDATR